MSNYKSRAKRPEGEKFEDVYMLDDFYGKHNYGVKFPDETIYPEDKCIFNEAETRDSDCEYWYQMGIKEGIKTSKSGRKMYQMGQNNIRGEICLGKICTNCGRDKEASLLTDWCDKCLNEE